MHHCRICAKYAQRNTKRNRAKDPLPASHAEHAGGCITCPRLLSSCCTTCNKWGHTSAYCDMLYAEDLTDFMTHLALSPLQAAHRQMDREAADVVVAEYYAFGHRCTYCDTYSSGRDPLRNTHRVSDCFGVTTCPRILATTCSTCGKQGHTRAHCDLTARTNRAAVCQQSPTVHEQDELVLHV
jgi:hypothetical protein